MRIWNIVKRIPVPAVLFGGLVATITGVFPIGNAQMNVILNEIDALVLPNVKHPAMALLFAGLCAAYIFYHLLTWLHDRHGRTRLKLANLRTEGVALRNKGQSSNVNVSEWSAESLAWMEKTFRVIQTIDRADAEWFRTLDTVPLPRVMFATTARAFAEHDFWLVKLEELIKRHAQIAH
jgi:hypothetical protein